MRPSRIVSLSIKRATIVRMFCVGSIFADN